jgi:transposase
MKYSLAFKESQVKKVLPPMNRSVREVARETGVSDQTIRNWLSKTKEGTLSHGTKVGNADRSPREKLNIVIESRTISDDDKGQWLRKNGLHSQHITQYEQELRDMVENRNHDEKMEKKKLIQENKSLRKELAKKEKALAEMAALYTLKKKAEELWGEIEED